MERHLDENSADDLLSGSVLPDDAPPGLAPVAALLHDLRAAAPADVGREGAIVRAMAEALDSAPAQSSRRRVRLLSGVVAGAVLLSSGAAAATGALPAPAQNVASTVLGSIGVDVPKAEAKAAKRAAKADAKAARDAAKADEGDDDGTDDGGADKADNHGRDVSNVARTTDATGAAKGSEVCTTASDGRCQPEKPAGPPADKPAGPPADKPAGPPADKPAGPPADKGPGGEGGDDTETDGDETGDETAGDEG